MTLRVLLQDRLTVPSVKALLRLTTEIVTFDLSEIITGNQMKNLGIKLFVCKKKRMARYDLVSEFAVVSVFNMLLQHDNAPAHTAQKIKNYAFGVSSTSSIFTRPRTLRYHMLSTKRKMAS